MIPPIHLPLLLCVIVTAGNCTLNSCIRSATKIPNRVWMSALRYSTQDVDTATRGDPWVEDTNLDYVEPFF